MIMNVDVLKSVDDETLRQLLLDNTTSGYETAEHRKRIRVQYGLMNRDELLRKAYELLTTVIIEDVVSQCTPQYDYLKEWVKKDEHIDVPRQRTTKVDVRCSSEDAFLVEAMHKRFVKNASVVSNGLVGVTLYEDNEHNRRVIKRCAQRTGYIGDVLYVKG